LSLGACGRRFGVGGSGRLTAVEASERRVLVGRIAGPYGVRGWVRVDSHTEPTENILSYDPWQVGLAGGWVSYRVMEGRRHGGGVVARLEGCDDRESARRLLGADIAVARGQLPALGAGEYYWADLVGLRVVAGGGGRELGRVAGLMETGANDVLVVQGAREWLVPFLMDRVVTGIDLELGVVYVDWDTAF